ncbi:dihydrolipoyl dehydrogenase [Ruminococcaceae bacterium OttesenSCG-928-D13]|nr:dihydrolipoyl dehydrogenase [Ruminococcaceae bacterium OttesenSCG-928-D13]
MQSFDLVIIGGGPAGYLAGERAAQAGLKPAVIEKRALGGVCLNEGCIPSKTFLNSAKIYDYALHGDKYGVTTTGAAIDHNFVVRRKNKVVKKLVAGVGAKLKAHEVPVFKAEGGITGKTAEGFTVQAGEETILGKKLLICAGSEAIVPPIPGVKEGIESGFVLTSREILDLTEVPESLVVVGGGVIGLEMASYFATIGSKVSVVEMLDKIAGPTENEVSAALQKACADKGITFHLGCKVTAVGADSVSFEAADGKQEIKAAKVLLSIGRRAASANLGLEAIGVLVERGAVVTDQHMQTNVAGVYAAGDINGKSMLAHTAYREAEVAVNHMVGKRDQMRYNAIPSVIYTNPEVAGVGETEQTAAEKGIPVKVAKLPMAYAGRYVAEVERGEGFCKLIMDTRYNTLVGCHIIGSYASEMIFGAGLMIETEMKIDNIKELVFPHPTVSEIIRETLFEL